jgi:hypothetical protein
MCLVLFANLKINFHAILHILALILFLPLISIPLKAIFSYITFKDPFCSSLHLGYSKISNSILRDIQRLNQGVLYFQDTIRFYSTRVNAILLTPTRNVTRSPSR